MNRFASQIPRQQQQYFHDFITQHSSSQQVRFALQHTATHTATRTAALKPPVAATAVFL